MIEVEAVALSQSKTLRRLAPPVDKNRRVAYMQAALLT